MTHYRVVFITVSSFKEAKEIADALVDKRLAACVNIIPRIKSIYLWKQKKEESDELLLIAKTNKKNVSKIIDEVKSLHSYEVPEIISLPIDEGSKDYLKWIDESCRLPET